VVLFSDSLSLYEDPGVDEQKNPHIDQQVVERLRAVTDSANLPNGLSVLLAEARTCGEPSRRLPTPGPSRRPGLTRPQGRERARGIVNE
jgi:hypothetical protein